MDQGIDDAPYFMVVSTRKNKEASEKMIAGVDFVLKEKGADCRHITVPSVFEIPSTIEFSIRGHEFYSGRKRFDGFIVLGDVGSEDIDLLVYSSCTNALHKLILDHSLAIGNGIIKCDNKNKVEEVGRYAAETCIEMLELKRQFGMRPR